MLGQYVKVFVSPFFWLLLTIALIITYIIYRHYFVGFYTNGFSEEEEQMAKHLKHYGYAFIGSEAQDDIGPFANEKLAVAPQNPDAVFRFHKVKAQKENGDEVELWAKIEYDAATMKTVNWLPQLVAQNLSS